MKSYKVEFEEVLTYVVDVQAESEADATDKATVLFEDKRRLGIEHYFLTGDTRLDIGTVYDVTGTDDDAFLSDNK